MRSIRQRSNGNLDGGRPRHSTRVLKRPCSGIATIGHGGGPSSIAVTRQSASEGWSSEIANDSQPTPSISVHDCEDFAVAVACEVLGSGYLGHLTTRLWACGNAIVCKPGSARPRLPHRGAEWPLRAAATLGGQARTVLCVKRLRSGTVAMLICHLQASGPRSRGARSGRIMSGHPLLVQDKQALQGSSSSWVPRRNRAAAARRKTCDEAVHPEYAVLIRVDRQHQAGPTRFGPTRRDEQNEGHADLDLPLDQQSASRPAILGALRWHHGVGA
jgi:hypothetical protein